jgi:hypothetical protein
VKTGCRKKIPTLSNVWPCALCIVIAYASFAGNWRRHRLKGTLMFYFVYMVILGMKCTVSVCVPDIILTCRTLGLESMIIIRVTLHSPVAMHKLRSSMTIQLLF